MSRAIHSVALVVDRHFGDRLVALAERLHVWVVESPVNRSVAERIWRDSGGAQSLERGVTTFRARESDSPSALAEAQLASIDLHHGEYSHSPPWSVLEVYGTEPTAMLTAALREFGLTEIRRCAGFFIASPSTRE